MKPRSVAVLVVSVLLVGGLVAAVVLLSGGNGVRLPDEVNGVPALDSAAAVPDDNERKDEILETQREVRERVGERYADAYDGAEADVRSYTEIDEEDAPYYSVLAIELDAGPLLPEQPLDDAEYLGYAVPQTEVVAEGDAECLLRRSRPPLADSEFDDSDTRPDSVLCQRTSGSLTVRVASSRGTTLDDVLEFLDAVWDELD